MVILVTKYYQVLFVSVYRKLLRSIGICATGDRMSIGFLSKFCTLHMLPGGVIPASKLPLAFEEKRIRSRKRSADGLKRLAR